MRDCLTATVLVENSSAEGLLCEHGLSVHLRYRRAGAETNVVLDFGQSGAFAENARTLGVDLDCVDAAVLSHAHYDHADGMPAFFERNSEAPLYLSAACAETCWSTKGGTTDAHYIGIGVGLLDAYGARLRRVPTDTVTTIAPGIHLVPHTTEGLAEAGSSAGMLLRGEDGWLPDDFAHEVSLVFELGEGDQAPLAVFNSCSHAGLSVIAGEVRAAFPGRAIAAYVGGLHLYKLTDEELSVLADELACSGISKILTGHCTGEHAYAFLRQRLGEQIGQVSVGFTWVF